MDSDTQGQIYVVTSIINLVLGFCQLLVGIIGLFV